MALNANSTQAEKNAHYRKALETYADRVSAHDADANPLGQNQDVTGLRQVVPFDACRMHEADRHQPV